MSQAHLDTSHSFAGGTNHNLIPHYDSSTPALAQTKIVSRVPRINITPDARSHTSLPGSTDPSTTRTDVSLIQLSWDPAHTETGVWRLGSELATTVKGEGSPSTCAESPQGPSQGGFSDSKNADEEIISESRSSETPEIPVPDHLPRPSSTSLASPPGSMSPCKPGQATEGYLVNEAPFRRVLTERRSLSKPESSSTLADMLSSGHLQQPSYPPNWSQ